MEYKFGPHHWKTKERGEETGILLTNGLGGFYSQTLLGSCCRNDQGLLMAAVTAPNKRVLLISQIEEHMHINGKEYDLSAQQIKGEAHNGFAYLQSVVVGQVPQWCYLTEGVELTKQLVMVHGENTVIIRYQIYNPLKKKVQISGIPYLVFAPKGQSYEKGCISSVKLEKNQILIEGNGCQLFLQSEADMTLLEKRIEKQLHYEREIEDGRMRDGKVLCVCAYHFTTQKEQDVFEICISDQKRQHTFETAMKWEEDRNSRLLQTAALVDPFAKELVLTADKFVAYRESCDGMTILAGYPFFGDWGRDTMIAMLGCTISTRQYETSKSIFRTFIKYCKKGIMPNLFPEGEAKPMYNTVDASLLFINAVYEYVELSKDTEFLKEAYPVMQEILHWYRVGTDFHIRMDEDGLLMAGEEIEQLTWMDVRIDDFLPTPRHGKPVEINSYWYNALKIMEYFSKKTKDRYSVYKEENEQFYGKLAKQVKDSFVEKFWMEKEGYLRDVLTEGGSLYAETQIRCNQVWALSLPFTMLDRTKGRRILNTIYETLYTPLGLRSLAMEDSEFHGIYTGEQKERDMAYHQGTVWTFPLGAYYLAELAYGENTMEVCQRIRKQLSPLEASLKEGCVGALAEVYDGKMPNVSKGCYAQAWSVGEILRVYRKLEELENKNQS